MNKAFFIAPVLALFFAGCTMTPKYERPAAPVSDAWPHQPGASNEFSAADIPWNEFFDDPRLQRLVELSLTNNRDFRIAALRVEQARAQYRIQRSALFP